MNIKELEKQKKRHRTHTFGDRKKRKYHCIYCEGIER